MARRLFTGDPELPSGSLLDVSTSSIAMVSVLIISLRCHLLLAGTKPCRSVHKGAFLRDMANGDTKYCSTLLMYCLLTRAAAISNQPGLRALALADDPDDEPPYLVRKCVQLLQPELDRPGITTAQSLQLLSEMHCAISHDTKGWMYAGGAGRLAYELGLHSNSESLGNSLTEVDHEVRKIVFWSAFNLDR